MNRGAWLVIAVVIIISSVEYPSAAPGDRKPLFPNFTTIQKIGTGGDGNPTWEGGVWPGGGATSADNVSYDNPTYTTVDAALDALLYVAPNITSLTGGSSNEVGSTVTSVQLDWAITLGSASLTSQSIDNGIGSISTALRTYTHGGQSITSNRTYTLTITDGTTPDTAATTVAFYRRRHWGATATVLGSIDSAAILALGAPSNEFATGHGKTITYDCTGGKYPTYAFPTSFGALSDVTVGGLGFTDYTCSTVSHTNASGSTTNYYVCQFNYLQTGSAITVVWN